MSDSNQRFRQIPSKALSLNQPSDPSFVKVVEIFLVPSSFLVAAVGAADTNIHRALISVLGLMISVLWWLCGRDAVAELDDQSRRRLRTRLLTSLSLIFMVGWFLSAIIHAVLWNRPLGAG